MKYLMTFILIFLSISKLANAYDPPKGLKWGMSPADVQETLINAEEKDKAKTGKVFEPGKAAIFYPKEDIDKDKRFYLVSLEKVTLLDKKIREGYLAFDTSNHLVLVQYQFSDFGAEDNSYSSCWAFYQRLYEALVAKYDTASSNDVTSALIGEPLVENTHYDTRWKDATSGEEITLTICNWKWGTKLLHITSYWVILRYGNGIWTNSRLNKLKNVDL
jgi:hypothetical protein